MEEDRSNDDWRMFSSCNRTLLLFILRTKSMIPIARVARNLKVLDITFLDSASRLAVKSGIDHDYQRV